MGMFVHDEDNIVTPTFLTEDGFTAVVCPHCISTFETGGFDVDEGNIECAICNELIKIASDNMD